MSDPGDPPRKFYDLKPREFERVNPPRPPAAGEPEAPARAPRPVAPETGPIDVKAMFREAQLGRRLRSVEERERAAAANPNEVHDILRDNHARADAAGLNEVSLAPKRASRRRRDYLVMMTIGSAFLGLMAVFSGFSALAGNKGAAIAFVSSSAGLVMFNIALYWVMFHIMEDY